MSSVRFLALCTALLLLLIPLDTSAAEEKLSRLKQRTLAELGTFSPEKRLQIHAAMNDLYMRLWLDSKKRKRLFEAETTTFPEHPLLQLSDKDGDKMAEEFLYSKARKDLETREFGCYFDLNGDGAADYLVFNGGTMSKESDQEFELWWMNYHAIDGNGDGRIDQVLYQGSTDINGNGKVEPGVGLWLIDDNLDGGIDSAIYLGDSFSETVPVVGDRFDFRLNLILANKTVRPGDPIGQFWDRILGDINDALGAGGSKR